MCRVVRSLLPGVLALALCAAATAGDGPPSPVFDPQPLGANEAALLQAVNDYRAARGLGRWRPDDRPQRLAHEASAAMARRGEASHDGFRQRLANSGARLCVEVLAQGRGGTPQQVVSLWRRSPQHHPSLVEPAVQRAGLAIVDGYTTLLACGERRG